MNPGDQVKAKKFITTGYEKEGEIKEDIDAWPGEIGTIICQAESGLYNVQFGKCITMVHASEVEPMVAS